MKKTLVTIAALMLGVSVYAQGNLLFGNSATSLVKTNDGKGNIGNMQNSMGPFMFELWWGPASGYSNGVSTGLSPLMIAGTNVWQRSSGVSAGRISSSATLPVTGTAVGDWITIQVRGWSQALGTTYLAAKANADSGLPQYATSWIGVSGLGVYKLQGTIPAPSTVMLGADTSGSIQIGSFDLTPVPEPSTIALVGLGLAGLYFIRRRK
jgi:hypothetical protein